jgi:hypothetical protein
MHGSYITISNTFGPPHRKEKHNFLKKTNTTRNAIHSRRMLLPQSRKSRWLPNRDPLSYSACQIGPSVFYRFQSRWEAVVRSSQNEQAPHMLNQASNADCRRKSTTIHSQLCSAAAAVSRALLRSGCSRFASARGTYATRRVPSSQYVSSSIMPLR